MEDQVGVESGVRPSSSNPSIQAVFRPDDRLRSNSAAVKTGSSNNEENVRVIVRVRPLSTKEEQKGCWDILAVDQIDSSITAHNPTAASGAKKTFRFDAVFGTESTQAELFNQVARPIIQNVIQGYNGTIFAYGQTGTGKTFTMEGDRGVPELKGIIPNSFAQIFGYIAKESDTSKFLVRVSYLEIYNEDVRDLLGKDVLKKLEIKEKSGSGVFVKNLSSFVVRNEHDMEKILKVGNKNRVTGSTNMNSQSSRSHAIFSIHVECSTEIGGERTLRMGKLNLVDLAGSERVSKTGATGQRLKEGAKINLSLSSLGNVIAALVEAQQHIPYRSSKLTRLLQDSLGGNSKTVMIANVGPADYNYDETISTLRYADRAKQIKNSAHINEDPKDALLRQFEKEIEELRLQLEQGDLTEKTRRVHSIENWDDDDEEDDQLMGGADEETLRGIRGELETQERLTSVVKTESEHKKSALNALKENVLTWKQQQERKAALEEKLKAIQKKIMVGGENLLDKSQEQEAFLQSSMKELQHRRKEQLKLQSSLTSKLAEKAEAEQTILDLQATLRETRRECRAVLRTYQKEQMEDAAALEEEEAERDALVTEINRVVLKNRKSELIINAFIPPEELKLIKKCMKYNSEAESWEIPCIAYAGNHVEHVTTITSPPPRNQNKKVNWEFLYKTFDNYDEGVEAVDGKTPRSYVDIPPVRTTEAYTEEERNQIIAQYYESQRKSQLGPTEETTSDSSGSEMEVFDLTKEQ